MDSFSADEDEPVVRAYEKCLLYPVNTVQFPPLSVVHPLLGISVTPPECACAHSGTVGIVSHITCLPERDVGLLPRRLG